MARQIAVLTGRIKELKGDHPAEARRFVVRQLQVAGGKDAVPALAGCLADKEVGEAARQALAAIPAPEAVAALRAFLPRASGPMRVGIVDALGARRDREAVDALIREVSSADEAQTFGERLVGFTPEVQAKKRELEAFLFRNVYQHYRVQRMANKAKRFIIELFEEYVREPSQLPPRQQARGEEEMADGLGREDALRRVVCDYIAGMTDRYAQDEYKRLFHPFERV